MNPLLRILSATERRIVASELAVIAVALAVMLAAVCVNVVARTFVLPLPDLSEPALIAMSVLAFIGSAYAVQSRNHIVVDLGDLIRSRRWQRWSTWLVDVAVVALSVLILVYGGEFLAFVIQADERTAMLDLPVALPVGCLVVGSLLSIFHVACRFARALGGAAIAPAADELGPPLANLE